MRVVKAHIGSKILISTVQDSQNNIQPASDTNSESDSDSDRIESIVGSSSYSSEQNDSGDQTADSQQEKLKKRYLSLVFLNMDMSPLIRELIAPWYNIHEEM